jgi:hypothetical protein
MPDADKTFRIDLETRATGTGAAQTEAELARLKQEAAAPAATSPVAPGVSPASGPPQAALDAERAAVSAAVLSDAEKEVAIQSQLQTIAGTRLELVQAQTAGDEARAAILTNELRIRTAILGVMRTETLTQAELNALAITEEAALGAAGVTGKAATEGIAAGSLLAGANLTRARQEALVLVRELQTGGNVTRTFGSLLGSLGVPLTIAGLAGVALWKAIKSSNEDTNKLIGETKQLGDELGSVAKKWQESARAALGSEDVRKIAESAVPELDRIHAKVLQIQQEELDWFQKITDAGRNALVQASTFTRGEGFSAGDRGKVYKNQLDQIKANAAAQEEAARAEAARDIERAERFKALFEQRKTQPVDQSASEISKTIDDLRTKQAALNKDAADYAQKYSDLGKDIEQNEKQLRVLIDLDKERAAILDDQKTKQEKITDELQRIQTLLKAIGVDAKTPGEVFEIGAAKAGALGAEIRKLARDLANLQNQAKEAADTALARASAQVKAVIANEQAAAKARAEGNERDADLYAKSASKFAETANPAELANLRKLRGEPAGGGPKPTEPLPGGPVAGIGETQESVNRIEERKRAFEKQFGTPPPASAPVAGRAEAGPPQGGLTAEQIANAVASAVAGAIGGPSGQALAGTGAGAASGVQEIVAAVKENTSWLQRLYQIWQ